MLILLLNYGCTPIKESPKYQFANGIYKIKSNDGKKLGYIQVDEDFIKAYYLNQKRQIDTSQKLIIWLKDTANASNAPSFIFGKGSFDIDFLSIPLKFRPKTFLLPAQLNSNINGGVYIGRRRDVYSLKKRRNELNYSNAYIDHYGYSFGLFAGLGSTAMNPWVTNNEIQIEYDGAIIPIGVTGLFAVNNITFGIGVGIDHLLDKNRKFWIYKEKPWIGLTIGLNLN